MAAVTKKYFLRKNSLIQLKVIPATKKNPGAHEWSRPKVCADGWAVYETAVSIAQLEEELKAGLLTEIPAKYFEKNREVWLASKRKEDGEEL